MNRKFDELSILLVDDQENWRTALGTVLENEGYIVEKVSNFQDAINEINSKNYSLVILDVRLVDTDIFNVEGLELLKQAKSKALPPKVIILTGYPESIDDGVLQRYGADELILKVPPGSKFDTQDFPLPLWKNPV